jgi:hypothetical protein
MPLWAIVLIVFLFILALGGFGYAPLLIQTSAGGLRCQPALVRLLRKRISTLAT